MRCSIILLLIICFIGASRSAVSLPAPSITYVSAPFFLTSERYFDILGVGFTSPLTKFYINDVEFPILSSNDTFMTISLEYKNLPIPANGEYKFKISTSGIDSNIFTVIGFDNPKVSQNNQIVYLTSADGSGVFDKVDWTGVKAGYITPYSLITKVNATTLSFAAFAEGAKVKRYTMFDRYAKPSFTAPTSLLAPVVSNYMWVGQKIQINGFYYVSPMEVYVDGYNCTIESLYPTQVLCKPIDDYFKYITDTTNIPVLQVQFIDPSLVIPPTYLNGKMVSLQSFNKSGETTFINVISSSNAGPVAPVLTGLTSAPITLIEYNSTMATFIVPGSAQCGVSYLSLADGTRVSNKMLICPTPGLIDGIFNRNSQITVRGVFLNTTLYGSSTSAIKFYFVLPNGVQSDCVSPIVTMTPNYIYTVTCTVPDLINSIKFVAQTVGNTSATMVLQYPKYITINKVTSTYYAKSGTVSLLGKNFNDVKNVIIGTVQCNSPMVNNDGTLITCIFASSALYADPLVPFLNVTVITNQDQLTLPLFSYTCDIACNQGTCQYTTNTCACPNNGWSGDNCNQVVPTIVTSTSTVYGTPGKVTIRGTNFVNLNPQVTIGGSTCGNVVVSNDLTTIVCDYQSNVESINNAPLIVAVIIDGRFSTSNPVFYYTKVCPSGSNGLECSGHGTCNKEFSCVCDSRWINADCSAIDPPTIKGTTTTAKYGLPGLVTIYGSNFVNYNLQATIGGSICSNIAVSQDLTSLTCQFKGDVKVMNDGDLLDVMVSVDNQFTATAKVYQYAPQCLKNGVVCNGHGVCNSTFACDCDKGWSSDCSVVVPTIKSASAIKYGVPGTVTIVGENFVNLNLKVNIGESVCSNVVVSQDLTTITCQFKSDIRIKNDGDLLQVVVIVDNQFTAFANVFTYLPQCLKNGVVCYERGVCNQQTFTCDCDKGWSSSNCSVIHPSIKSVSAIKFGTPSTVTIVGENLVNKNLEVTIGSSICGNVVVSPDLTTLTCLFQSNIPVYNDNESLAVIVVIDSQFRAASTFYYLKQCINNGIICSSRGVCNQQTFTCDCEKGWSSSSNCSAIYPTINAATSTKQNTPGLVTIYGSNFVNWNLKVNINSSSCTDITVSDDLTSITCMFQSDIQVSNINQALTVYVGINDKFSTKNDVFIYGKPEQTCPIKDGKLCSSNGLCNQQFLCECNKGWESSDCSVQDITQELGVVLEIPKIKKDDTASLIKAPSGIYYDVGIEMINEITGSNDLVLSYSLKNIRWISQSDQEHHYTTELPNNSTVDVRLTLNSQDQRVYYNFAGDSIPILPKSVKYQIQLTNWPFSNSQNSVEFIFKSGIAPKDEQESQNTNQCGHQETTTTTKTTDDSIRSIQISLNGETLIGTFSDRMILDSRPAYNRVNQLSAMQITKYQLDTAPVYTSIQTSYFKNSVIVDPNFGVLVSSAPEECKTSSGIASWKLAVIIVCSVVGASLIVTATWVFLKKSSKAKILMFKMRSFKN
ncbi:hypothetical protein CYY_005971 [Polysphondylium violaceum]|uniref:EGF-like domain-containing protein n=1 Tax=Polysphondylium violaceum TaxID=133409 RepID=A0A8J4PSZ6_9MYCE|nr:hypothetical protein CYY_005971 [Polysphondylium violaceum]